MNNAVTIYIDSDPSCLGDTATADDVETYADNLCEQLAEEFALDEVIVRKQIGGWSWRCLENDEVDARIREIESGDEWISLLG